MRRLPTGFVSLSLVLVLSASAARAQSGSGAAPAQASAQPADALGRDTPHGTVLGFLGAARKGENDLARQYLNTRLDSRDAAELARQLFVVLDARLPARLARLSDHSEGSRSDPLAPNVDLVGTIAASSGTVDVLVERVRRGDAGPIWLFSTRTLDAIPAVYEEVAAAEARGTVRGLLTGTRVGRVRVLQWIAVLFGLAAFYVLTSLLNRALTPLVRMGVRRLTGNPPALDRDVLPAPARLLILAVAGRWVLSLLPLSLIIREVWSNVATFLAIVASAWLLIVVNGRAEEYFRKRLPGPGVPAAVSLLRLGRRAVDVLVIFAALLVTLRHFGVDPTPALAGLGVGGIAVALAAQKTLENVIAGASLIFDQAVRVGDFLKVGDIEGTVDHIGLRSTRIRTLDRTMVSVPNSQIANMSLETFSARDKFWFHPAIGLRYETTSDQLRSVVGGIERLLREHPSVDGDSVRVRFFRLGASSLDVDVFAYVYARDWTHFLEIQEHLLFSVTEIVSKAGTAMAFPSQTMYLANAAGAGDLDVVAPR